MLVDCIRLAYCTFQRCRHCRSDVATWLTVLEQVLPLVIEHGVLTIAVHDDVVASLPDMELHCIQGDARPVPLVTPDRRRALSFCITAAREMRRLHDHRYTRAVRAIGHAMHNLPTAIRDEALDDWEGNVDYYLSMAAPYWGELSEEMREAFAQGVGLSVIETERRVRTDGFACDLFREYPIDRR